MLTKTAIGVASIINDQLPHLIAPSANRPRGMFLLGPSHRSDSAWIHAINASSWSGVAISVGVGLFFGYYPANRAANLDPIVCLRYE
jgi:ABC-type antimicrobial peptide transport system permease subunit